MDFYVCTMIKDVHVKSFGRKGKRVFALRAFKKDEFIFRTRRGRIIKQKDLYKLSKEDQIHLDQIDKGVFEVLPSPQCYINHSCDPNAILKGKSLFALKSIKSGEEITADYRISALNEGWTQKCLCGSKKCEGTIKGDFFTMSEELQKTYLPYAPKFIQEEYKKRHENG